MDNSSKTVLKALDILEIFLQNDVPLNLSDISRTTKLNPATAYRLTSTLLKRGYISQGENKGKYSLGLKLMDYNYAIRRNLKFIDFAYISLSKLRREVNESVYLAVKDGDESIVMEEIGVDDELRINSPIGKRLKLHCTAGGKIFLANLSDEERGAYFRRNPLQPFTKNTITDIAQLEKELKTIKMEGVAFDREEYRMGIWAVGAPVYDTGDNVIAIAGLLVLRSHVTEENTQKYATAIKSCAGEISQIVTRIM